jgi:hypothetical protein
MNAIVAIGGAPILRAVSAYRTLVPSAVWVLGLKTPRDPKDELLRSLEALIEPLMQPYFAAEAQAQVASISAHLTTQLLPARNIDPSRLVNAVSATLAKGIADAFALVAMLDRAHALQPVELVLTDDGSALARTAVAWARARGLPSATLPARVPLRRPRKPSADQTIALSERGRQSYLALDADEASLVSLLQQQALYSTGANERAARRREGKAALERALAWPENDIVIVFEPAAFERESALEAADACGASLAAMFNALAVARGSVPTLRLVVLDRPSSNGYALAEQAASNAGLAAGDFSYAQADDEVWIAAADIVVSVDSTRSMDAAGAGVPAVNLWRPANWYLGPSFAAQDGVIDVPPHLLGATLVALAGDLALRTQIAAIAGDRISINAPSGLQSGVAIAGDLVTRRHHPPAIVRTTKPDIVICAPPYSHNSAGLRALYRLCHFINLVGGDASIYPGTQVHPTWNTPRRDTAITDRTIVVYPEIFFRTSAAKRVVRWVLNEPGLLGGPKSYDADEMVFYYHEMYRAAAQAATAELLTGERELQIAVIDPELFFNDRSRPRLYDCVFIYKGKAIYDRMRPRETRDAYEIRSDWPASRAETAALLRGCRRLYTFDACSAIIMEAVICGVQVFIVRPDGELYEVPWLFPDYAREYYDMSAAARFLRLVNERWAK